MHTLILNGSPHPNGDTAWMIRTLRQNLSGTVTEIRAYDTAARPCVDCRRCWKTPGCVIRDDMQQIYAEIQAADRIVIASPVYFSELSGALLAMLSRLQMYYAARRFLHTELLQKPKRGAILLCGGGDGSPQKAEQTAKTLLRFMRASAERTVCSLRTDECPAVQDEACRAALLQLATDWETAL